MAAGIEDVARLAGVSAATVSRALRGMPNVSAATRDRVRSAAAMLGYVPSPSASSLASGRTRTIGLLTPFVNRWYFANVIDAAEREFRKVGLDSLLYTFTIRRRGRAPVDIRALRRRVDGIVVVALPLGTYESEALALGLPVVSVGNRIEGVPTVRVDDYEVGRSAARHLLALGHRRIGHVTGLPDIMSAWAPAADRRRGWQDTLSRAGQAVPPEWLVSGYFDLNGARESARLLLEQAPEITAIFAASDEMAMGAMIAARELGRRVPENLSIIGVDGHQMGEVVGLTTIAQDVERQGALAATCLLDLLAGDPPPAEDALIHPTQLIVRTSTAPPTT